MTRNFYGQRFDSIQILRGVSAIFIILEHIPALCCGAFGVDIFFAISGFMIMYTTKQGRKHFFRKRLLRILPLYYLMTIGSYLALLFFPAMFEQTTAQPVYLLKSLLFVPFDIGNGAIQPLMRIGWTVNCEIFFYLIFYLAMCVNHKYRGLLSCLILGGLVAAGAFLPSSWIILNFYSSPVMLDFIWGILCFYLAKTLYERFYDKMAHPAVHTMAVCACVGIFAILLISKPHINLLGFRRPLLWGIPGALLLLCSFAAGIAKSAFFNFLRRSFVHLGNMSYSVYLIHYYPVMLLDRVVFRSPETSSGFLLLCEILVCITVSILSATAAWWLIEKKLGNWLKEKLL